MTTTIDNNFLTVDQQSSNQTTLNSLNHPNSNVSGDYEKERIMGIVFDLTIPVLCTVGLVGNSMGVVLIQTTEQLKKLQSNEYLSASAICSCIFLINLLVTWGLPNVTPDWNYTQLENPWYCKLATFLAHGTDMAVVWLIVAVSVDRMIILSYPEIRTYRIRSARFTHFVTILIVALAVFVSSWTVFLAAPIRHHSRYYCLVEDKNLQLYSMFITFETIIGVLLPWAVILVMNAIILLKIRSYNKGCDRQELLQHRSSSTPSQPTNGHLLLPQAEKATTRTSVCIGLTPLGSNRPSPTEATVTTDYRTQSRSRAGSASLKNRLNEVQLTKSLLIVTTAFVLLNLPSYLCRLLLKDVSQPTLWHSAMWRLSYFLYYAHHAVLFYLYIFNSSQMKKQLKPTALRLLECYCLKTVPNFGHQSM